MYEYVYSCVDIYVCVHRYVNACVYIYVYIHEYTYVFVSVCEYEYIYIYIYVCDMCVHVPVCVCMSINRISRTLQMSPLEERLGASLVIEQL